jgi:hypothetical protein
MDSSEKVWLNMELPDNQNSFILVFLNFALSKTSPISVLPLTLSVSFPAFRNLATI